MTIKNRWMCSCGWALGKNAAASQPGRRHSRQLLPSFLGTLVLVLEARLKQKLAKAPTLGLQGQQRHERPRQQAGHAVSNYPRGQWRAK